MLVDFFAALGKIDEVKDFLSQSKMWSPTAEQAKVLEKCLASVEKGETVIKSWLLIAINLNDFEQQRVLVVTDKAHYRIKYH